MVDQEFSDNRVITDMSQDFNSKIAYLLESIDDLKISLYEDQRYIIGLSERLHTLFIKLSGKMDKEEIKKQYMFSKTLAFMPVITRRKTLNSYGELTTVSGINRRVYAKFRHVLERREIHLNQVLERVGLTSTQKDKKRKIW